MKERFWRRLSYNERLFLAAEELCPPLANQFFYDGKGELDAKKFREAVKAASEANPGSRLALRGHLHRSRWVDTGETPPVIEVDGSAWDGMGPDNAPFLMNRLHPRHGHTCEVMLIHGPIPRVALRTHHAVMDGMGTLSWSLDIFRHLRGEPLVGSSSRISDLELARSFQKEPRKPFPRDNITPTGRAEGNERGVVWKKKIIKGRFKNFLGQAAVITAKAAREHGSGNVLIGFPVDLRRRKKGISSTGNLSIAIYVPVNPDSTPEDVSNEIKRQIELKYDGMIDRWDPMIRFVPLRVMVRQGEKMIEKYNETGRYGVSGIITSMGRIPMQFYCGGGFTADCTWGIPPSLETLPFFLGTATYGEDNEVMILTLPKVLATGGRLDAMLDTIAKGLVPVTETK